MAPRKKTKLQLRALEILSNLKQLYPEATCSLNYQTPVQLLVAVILSAQWEHLTYAISNYT